MLNVFTKEWVQKLDAEIGSTFVDFSWDGQPPAAPLNITYKIRKKDDEIFSYHLKCSPNGFSVLEGDSNDSKTPCVTFTQDLDTALGIMRGELNTHVEFLMGKIHIQGDVLALEDYNPALELIYSCIASINAKIGDLKSI